MSPHLNRQDIDNAAADPLLYRQHLETCATCRLQVELVKLGQRAEVFVNAPTRFVMQARALARPERQPVLQSFLARLTFDSWANLAPAGVRGLGPDKERRLRFETDILRFDVRIEKNARIWTLAAQVKHLQDATPNFDIYCGSKRISPRDDNFYIWSIPHPPRKLRLVSPETTIVLPEIVWNDQPTR